MSVKPVILSRPDRIGDVIVTSTCVPLIRELHPGAPIVLIARRLMQPLFSGEGSVDEYIAYDNSKDDEKVLKRLQDLNPSVIYHFQPHVSVQTLAEKAGIPERVGFYQNNEMLGLTHQYAYKKSQGQMHEAEYCRQLLVHSFGDTVPEIKKACLAPEKEALIRLKDKAPWLNHDEIRIVINPTAARLLLRWPPESFEKLIKALSTSGRRIILVGHPDNDPALLYLREKCDSQTGTWSDLSGKLDLAESAWLFQNSHLHISRDTGTSHLATAMGCPALTIFARLEPEYGPVRWKALGDTSHIVTSETTKRWWETRRQFWKRSFRSIPVAKVKEAAESLI